MTESVVAHITRRNLLVGAGAVALGAAASRVQSQDPKPVGWAILGLGNYATRNILPNLKHCKHTKLAAVISGTPDKAKRIAGEYGLPESKIYSYDDMARIKDDPDIEVVYVITPPGTHAGFSIRAAEAGKHVCCEKPMASDSAECRAMIEACRKAGTRLQIGYRCHFEAHNLEAVRLCRSGVLGQIRTIRSEHGFTMNTDQSWHSKRALGGIGAISEIGIYAIQAMCYLAGADPVSVWGTRDKLDVPRFKEVEDVNHFNLFFPGGIQGIGSTAYSWNANNFRVLGSRGTLDAEPGTPYSGHRYRLNGQEMTIAPNNQWAEQMDHFSECVRDPSKPLIASGEMGLRDILIMEAILKSADEKRVVNL